MGKQDFKGYICRPFCCFFREGAKEEMACRGATIVEHLVQCGRLDRQRLPAEGKDPVLWQDHDHLLDAVACACCEFLPDGCDFQSAQPPAGAEPCGGYILLRLLKRSGVLSAADIEDCKHV
jgi:hypothetical protein